MTLFISGWVIIPLCLAAGIIVIAAIAAALDKTEDYLELLAITAVASVVVCLAISMFTRGTLATYREMTATSTKEAP